MVQAGGRGWIQAVVGVDDEYNELETDVMHSKAEAAHTTDGVWPYAGTVQLTVAYNCGVRIQE